MKKLFLILILSFTFFQLSFAQSNELIDNLRTSIDNNNHSEAIKILDKLIDIHQYDKAYLKDLYFWRGWQKYEYYGNDSAVIDYENAANLNHITAREFLQNKKKHDIYSTDDFIKETLNEKKLYKKNNYKVVYTKADSLQGTLSKYRSSFDVIHYNLNLLFNFNKKSIEGSNTITFKLLEKTDIIQIDLFKQYKISSIKYKSQNLKFERVENAIFVHLPNNLEINQNHRIEVFYEGKPQIAKRPPWQGGFVWSHDSLGNHWIGVACEHLGASSWWPNKDHLTDEPDSMAMSFTVPNEYDVVSNGNLLASKDTLYNKSKFTWKVSNPINNYNVTFYIGKYENFRGVYSDIENKIQFLDYYVLPFNKVKARRVFEQTEEVLKFYETTFGKYPFWTDGFGMVESPFAGMEHQGAIAYGNGYDPNIENTRYNNKKYDYIIVHEAAHEWWGNSLTVGDMADVWLHEGFATYSEWLFMENKFNHDEYLIEATDARKTIINKFPIIGNYGVNDNAFAGWDIYPKGATVLHNLRCMIDNDTLFFRLLKTFATKYCKKTITTNDFINHVNEITKTDYTPFFKTWLYRAKIPVLVYSIKKQNEKLIFNYKWENVEKGFKMCFGLVIENDSGVKITATDEFQSLDFPSNSKLIIPTGWHPSYKELPENTFTYFDKKLIE